MKIWRVKPNPSCNKCNGTGMQKARGEPSEFCMCLYDQLPDQFNDYRDEIEIAEECCDCDGMGFFSISHETCDQCEGSGLKKEAQEV